MDQARLPNGGWDHWTKIPPRVHWVDGDHDSILRPPMLTGLAKAVRTAMDEHLHLTTNHPS
jgi:thioesterase domain-containing protein